MKDTAKSHYFMSDENLKPNYKMIKYPYSGKILTFITNSGVFSPNYIDSASQLLVSILPALKGRVLDLGCGYGYIGIALKIKNPDIEIVLSDVNYRALECAKMNCDSNDIDAVIIESDGFESIHGNFDYIINNPPIHAGKEVVFRLYKEAFDHLKIGGYLFIIIQKKHGANSHSKKLIELFGSYSIIYKHKGYYIYSCKRT